MHLRSDVSRSSGQFPEMKSSGLPAYAGDMARGSVLL